MGFFNWIIKGGHAIKGGSAIKNKENPEIIWKTIKCPYCFKVFQHDEVHFKAMTLKTGSEWSGADDDFSIEDDEDFDLFRDLDRDDDELSDDDIDNLFRKKEDAKFKEFWDQYANELEWRYASYPVITRADKKMMSGDYQQDADGFVNSVRDRYGVETKERICPYCHNPLPSNYGKYKVHFIATVGITASGKTVYLSQLLSRMDEYMSNVNLGILNMTSANRRFLEEHPVKKSVPLPSGTVPGTLSTPLFYIILGDDERYTLVFYDVAGEDCVREEEMHKYGPFIENADGIIMILDPMQFTRINTTEGEIETPLMVLETMFNSFLGGSGGKKSEVPLALALSKSDILERRELFNININANSNIFRDIQYDRKNYGFDVRQYRNMMGEVRAFLSEMPEGRAMLGILERCFTKTGLFAFSALNCEVEGVGSSINGKMMSVMSVPIAHPNPRRIEEPLLWLLSEFGIIKKLETETAPRR